MSTASISQPVHMTSVLTAAAVLIVGAALALAPLTNALRARVSIASQLIATALVLSTALPILLGAPELSGQLSWAFPVGTVDMRLDALGAFFLVWSLPMTLLGSIYALGYLE